ncbi:polyphosphate kinase 1 [Catenovulum sp. SM1970]|uniref:polyphosphate kinase 1 n=1 Tax=Marinifaba aquimaris TaxID=2741323 RepID=UPI001571963C|nr:polyphosphate kinase 1 [Marinifaba aquimaris]NTS77680.1 polyphosphate kinase 1 [Marinifaba aquimaris]
MSKQSLFFEKELSWLSFNERVLQEAADEQVPIIERIRFLGIFSNNLDEFYRVRVADVKRRIMLEDAKGDSNDATLLLHQIQSKVLELQSQFESNYKSVIKGLTKRKIHFVTDQDLTAFQSKWVKKYFKTEVKAHMAPIIVSKKTDLIKHLADSASYLAIGMSKGDETQLAILDIPTDALSRFVLLPPERSKVKKSIILLDDIIRHCLDDIFGGFFDFDDITAHSFKLTRDAEYGLTDEIDQSLVEQTSEALKQRLYAEPTRVVYDREMPDKVVKLLGNKLSIGKVEDSLLPGGRYRNFKDFIGFPNVGRAYLENKPLPALRHPDFDKFENYFDAIKNKDILLYYPYHTFDHFTELVRQAAFDPNVKSIKLNIYRVAKNSKIIYSLMDAIKNGKSVKVVVELKARFDESNNIEWAKQMTDAGIRVVFSTQNLKIHSKLCLISRVEDDEVVNYVHIGTGNFHEKTAKIYTDYSLFLRNSEISSEVEQVFEFAENLHRRPKFQHIFVSPINFRSRLANLIDFEISQAKQGQKAKITAKINNLVDEKLVLKLYEASQAGVQVKLIVRGMCSLIPQVEGLSEHIEVISIVDRFLEHPRVFIFHHAGEDKTYISSADWMTRNLDHRIEVATPIYEESLKKTIKNIFSIEFSDTTKARVVDAQQSNAYVKRGNRRKIRSQHAIYEYLKGKAE